MGHCNCLATTLHFTCENNYTKENLSDLVLDLCKDIRWILLVTYINIVFFYPYRNHKFQSKLGITRYSTTR